MEKLSTDNIFDDSSSILTTATIDISGVHLEDELELDSPGLFAALTQGIVVTEHRVTGDHQIEDVQVFTSRMVRSDDALRSNPNSERAQRDYFTQAIQDTETVRSVANKMTAEKLDLCQQIPSQWLKGVSKLKMGGQTYQLPAVKTEFMTAAEEWSRTVLQSYCDRLKALAELKDQSIDLAATLSKLERQVAPRVRDVSRNPIRTRMNINLGLVILVESLILKSEERLSDEIVHRGIVQDQLTQGCFVRLKDCSSTPQQRLESMASDDSVGVSLSPTYRLNCRQLHDLKNYIFSRDARVRTASKIDLLSTVNQDVRTDLVRYPGKVLLRSFHESCLTRTEILQFMFQPENSRENAVHCMCCGRAITIENRSVLHQPCAMSDWLVQQCQFEYQGDRIVAPSYAYIKPGLTRYIRQILQVKHRQEACAITLQGDESISAFTKTSSGRPQKLFQHGFPSVHVRGGQVCSVTSHQYHHLPP
nr:TPA_asm: hypothetical protein [Pseudoglobivirus]